MSASWARSLRLGCALATSGCAIVEPKYKGPVDVVATAEGIVVTNETNYAVQVHSIAEAALPLWDTYPCFEGTRVLPGETTTLAWATESQSYPAPNRYLVRWWRDGTCSTSTDDGPRGGVTVTR